MKLYTQESDSKEKLNKTHELYSTILSSPVLDAQEKKPARISQEAFVVLVAGSDTTARVLTTSIFHVLDNKHKLMPLLQEEFQKSQKRVVGNEQLFVYGRCLIGLPR